MRAAARGWGLLPGLFHPHSSRAQLCLTRVVGLAQLEISVFLPSTLATDSVIAH